MLARYGQKSAVCLALMISFVSHPAAAKHACDTQSTKGDICLCELSDLHPTQASVGIEEVRIKAENLKDQFKGRSERDFLKYLRKHNKEEPVVIGPNGIFYIIDHHHLARALYDIGASETYCIIVDNLSDTKLANFWKRLEDDNQVYLKDANGNPITPDDLPTSVNNMSNDPFRSLAGAVRELCGFEKNDKSAGGEDYLEFQWADYFRAHWAQTGITVKDIDADFERATDAALQLATRKDAVSLQVIRGKFHATDRHSFCPSTKLWPARLRPFAFC